MIQDIDIEISKNSGGRLDIAFQDNGDFTLDKGLDTAIQMSLLCERRASPDEMPENSRRRGWWGNEFGDVTGFEIGSKLWLVSQQRLTQETKNKIKDIAFRALSWLVEDDIAIDVQTDVVEQNGTVFLNIILERPGSTVDRKFYELWNNTGS